MTRDHNSMLKEIERRAPLKPADLQHASTVDAVAISVQGPGPHRILEVSAVSDQLFKTL